LPFFYRTLYFVVVGSRGDVQPFVALGQELKKYGHRVRLATHEMFREFVKEGGLEFYPIAGDPNELLAYMVKSKFIAHHTSFYISILPIFSVIIIVIDPGLLPGFESIRAGDISKKRTMIAQVLESTWKSCIERDPLETGSTFNPLSSPAGSNSPSMSSSSGSSSDFLADAIIANPVSFGHIHCAQRLFIQCHIFFTMPWSPTRAFPHPLTNVNCMAPYLIFFVCPFN
jgi:hypothetical protein